MKHFCKGTATKYVEEYDEKIEKLLKVRFAVVVVTVAVTLVLLL
jgi:hypothetical protein